MWTSLLLGGALALGQQPVPSNTPSPAPRFPTQVSPVDSAPIAFTPRLESTAPTIPDVLSTDSPGSSPDGPPGNNGTNESAAKENPNEYLPCLKPKSDEGGKFHQRLYRAYYKEFFPSGNGNGEEEPPPARRALPAPFAAPFPTSEWQGFPLEPVMYFESPALAAAR